MSKDHLPESSCTELGAARPALVVFHVDNPHVPAPQPYPAIDVAGLVLIS